MPPFVTIRASASAPLRRSARASSRSLWPSSRSPWPYDRAVSKTVMPASAAAAIVSSARSSSRSGSVERRMQPRPMRSSDGPSHPGAFRTWRLRRLRSRCGSRGRAIPEMPLVRFASYGWPGPLSAVPHSAADHRLRRPALAEEDRRGEHAGPRRERPLRRRRRAADPRPERAPRGPRRDVARRPALRPLRPAPQVRAPLRAGLRRPLRRVDRDRGARGRPRDPAREGLRPVPGALRPSGRSSRSRRTRGSSSC